MSLNKLYRSLVAAQKHADTWIKPMVVVRYYASGAYEVVPVGAAGRLQAEVVYRNAAAQVAA